MARDEAVRERTVKRFLECEGKRAEARAAALAQGKAEYEAREIAHEAAKRHWNAWAEDMLAKRKALEESEAWALAKTHLGVFKTKNAATANWAVEAEANFSNCHFVRRTNELKKTDTFDAKILRIDIDNELIDFTGFTFPGDALFESAYFESHALFRGVNFELGVWFDNAKFYSSSSFLATAARGTASFNGVKFLGWASFGESIFSTPARFASTTFRGAVFESEACFEGVRFIGPAYFGGAYFSGASFKGATFTEDVTFHETLFLGKTSFESANFEADVWFDTAIFEDAAQFSRATFKGAAWFGTAIPAKVAFFGSTWIRKISRKKKTKFLGNTLFEGAVFSESTSFRNVEFGSEERGAHTDFTAIKVERAFDLTGACFSKVPSFCQADFKQAPDLDGVDFPLPPAEPFTSCDPDLIPKYRALRRMAIQGADYEREQMAFKGEMRSRRWKVDKPWHPEGFFGWCYDWAADCGRSIIRPFAIWAVSIFVFAVLYLPQGKNALDACVSGDGAMIWNSLYLSGRNATVFGGGRSETAAQAYQCLFGAGSAPLGVSSVESFVQAPLSAVRIFLFLLAVRNRFKIK